MLNPKGDNMAFQKVPQAQSLAELKREYKTLEKKYLQMRNTFIHNVQFEDFDLVNVEMFLEIKELYIMTTKLYWKIYEMEHPEDKATVAAYAFLNKLSFQEKSNFLKKHDLTTHGLIEKLNQNPNFIKEVTA